MVFGEGRCQGPGRLRDWMGVSLWTHCPHAWSGILSLAGPMEGVGVGSYPASLSTSCPHSAVIGNQSLAAIITAVKTINALHSGNIFWFLMDWALLHFWESAVHQGRCSFSWLPWCSSLVKFALRWLWVCAESSAVIRPQFLAAALLLFAPCSGCALFWVPCHLSGQTSLMDAPALLQNFLVLESLVLMSPFLRICSS